MLDTSGDALAAALQAGVYLLKPSLRELRELTGRDAPVMAFLQQHGEVAQMQQDVAQFLQRWLQALVHNHRSYVTVAIGCTGGQHRSVYLCEQLAQQFAAQWSTLVRHRELKS
mgnify:CR=1 FL=1